MAAKKRRAATPRQQRVSRGRAHSLPATARRGLRPAGAPSRSRSSSSPSAISNRNATPELSLAEMQRRVDDWIMQFEEGYWPPLSMLARLSEEVGELARELNHHYGHKPKKADERPGDIALEVADILFVLTCLCNSLQIDMTQAFERVLAKYTHRDARRWTPRRVR